VEDAARTSHRTIGLPFSGLSHSFVNEKKGYTPKHVTP
jgi:hypothetical protein